MQPAMAGQQVPDPASPSVTAMFLKIVKGRAEIDDYQRYLAQWDHLAATLTRRTKVVPPASTIRSRRSR